MNEELTKLMIDTMQHGQKLVSQAKTKDEYLCILGALLVVIQSEYIKYMGAKDTAQMLSNIAEELDNYASQQIDKTKYH